MYMKMDVLAYCVGSGTSIRATIARMDENRRGIIGTVSDGDVRRGILARINLEAPVTELLARKTGSRGVPITASIRADRQGYLSLFKQHGVTHIPLLDDQKRIAGLVGLDECLPDEAVSLQAVIMAGGRGKRLDPLTEDVPKPMLQVGGQPLLEIIIGQLRDSGIKQVTITTHHKAEKITGHFGNGEDFGVELSYTEEDQPLGTIGGLGLLALPKATTLVINGDILTRVDFRAMLMFHREHEADMTVAVRQYDLRVPYGVVECEGATIKRLSEKPVLNCFVNAGIYLLEPSVYRLIPNGQRFDMTDLIQRLLETHRPVISFPVREYWLDIGQSEDYEQAQKQVENWKLMG
jgi:dTDP-glucose pyrophosphorylase